MKSVYEKINVYLNAKKRITSMFRRVLAYIGFKHIWNKSHITYLKFISVVYGSLEIHTFILFIKILVWYSSVLHLVQTQVHWLHSMPSTISTWVSLWPEKEGTTIGIYEVPHGTVTQHCLTLLLVCSCVHSLFPHTGNCSCRNWETMGVGVLWLELLLLEALDPVNAGICGVPYVSNNGYVG